MRRGGRLILLLGVIIAFIAALFLYFFLQQSPPPTEVQVAVPTEPPKKQIVVARIDIQPNSVLTDTETLLQLGEISEAEFNAQPKNYFTSIGELQGKVTLRLVSAGAPILHDDVQEAGLSLQIPPAASNEARPKAFPLRVENLSGVADQITPGDFVDVIASFRITRTFLRPGVDDQGQIIIKEESVPDLLSTKTLVQNVQVLKVVKPPAAPEGTPTPGGPPPDQGAGPPETDASGQPVGSGAEAQPQQGGQPGSTLTTGTWILVLAVTDQEAEIIKFSREQNNAITLVLRGRGDTATETTIGATLDLLVASYGLPVPDPAAPAFFAPNELTQIPTTAPTATPVGAPAGTPTPTP
jgi:pilus assembly protein CpaB